MDDDAPCPCGSKLDYVRCCGLLHAGTPAGDAESLMRARYSAYALGIDDYVLRSWHPSTRPQSLGLDPAVKTKWLRLTILEHLAVDADHAIVEFVYKVIEAGLHRSVRERSRFLREDGRWYYLDGELLQVA